MCFWALGDFAMTYETLNGATPPDISLANILWIGFFPFAYVAVMMWMRHRGAEAALGQLPRRRHGRPGRQRRVHRLPLRRDQPAAGGDVKATAINLVYPTGDLFLFVLVLVGIMLLPVGDRPAGGWSARPVW